MARWMCRGFVLGFALITTWLVWSGHLTAFLISTGIGACLFVVCLARWMDILDEEGMPTALLLRSITYLPWLILQVVLSGAKVSLAIIDPRRKITPRVIRLPITQRTEIGAVVYANSITLTPGTLSIRMEDDHLLVHALFPEDAKTLQDGTMANRIAALEANS